MREQNVNDLIESETYQAITHIYKAIINASDSTTTSRIMDSFMTNEEFNRGINEIIVHEIAICISMCYENIDENNRKKLDDYFGKLESFNNIECLIEMDTKEKRRQIRNCFAHGHYKSFGSEEGCLAGIYIDNGKVKGIITHNDLYDLKRTFQYMASANGAASKNVFCVFCGPGLEKVKNEQTLKEALDKVKYYYFAGSIGKDNFDEVYKKLKYSDIALLEPEQLDNMITKINAMRTRGINHVDLQEKVLTEKEKEQLLGLIKNRGYITLNLLGLAFPRLKEEIILESIREITLNEQICPYDIEIYPLLYLVTQQKNVMTDKDKALCLKYGIERPFAYTKMILQYGFFVFDYLREMNERHSESLFNYTNFDLTGLEIRSFNNEKLIRVIDPKQLIQTEIITSEQRVAKLVSANQKLEQTRQRLQNPLNRHPKKDDYIAGIENSLGRNNDKINGELQKQEIKKEELVNCTAPPYTDCRHLFRHLRNAFAHSRYTVEYGETIKTDNYHDIKFHFEDYDDIKDETGNKIGERLAFTLDCDAKSLCRLLREIDVRVVNALKAQPTLTENKNSTNKK